MTLHEGFSTLSARLSATIFMRSASVIGGMFIGSVDRIWDSHCRVFGSHSRGSSNRDTAAGRRDRGFSGRTRSRLHYGQWHALRSRERGLRGKIWFPPVVSGLLLGACSIQTGVSDYPPDWPARVTGHASSCSWIDGEYADKGVYDLRGMDYPRSGQVTTAYGVFFRDAGYILAAANPDIANFADSIRLNWLEGQGLRITAMRAGADVASLIAAKDAVACNGDVIAAKGNLSLSGGDFELVGVDRKTMTLERASDGSLVVHTVFRRNSLQLLVFPFRERGDGWYRFAPAQAAQAVPSDSGGERFGSEAGSASAFQAGDVDEKIAEGVVEFRIGLEGAHG
jgi:hypothetical protein